MQEGLEKPVPAQKPEAPPSPEIKPNPFEMLSQTIRTRIEKAAKIEITTPRENEPEEEKKERERQEKRKKSAELLQDLLNRKLIFDNEIYLSFESPEEGREITVLLKKLGGEIKSYEILPDGVDEQGRPKYKTEEIRIRKEGDKFLFDRPPKKPTDTPTEKQQPTESSQQQEQSSPEQSTQSSEKRPEFNNEVSEEIAKEFVKTITCDVVFEDILSDANGEINPQIKEALMQILSDQEPNQAHLEALAERFGFITPTLVGKALEILGIPSADKTATDEDGQTINLREALKTALKAKEKSKKITPEEKRKLEIIRKLESAPPILTGKDVAEIFAVIDPDAFEGKNADQITIGDILTKTYQKMTGEEKKFLRAKKTEIEKQRKQKNQEGQQTSKQPGEEETPQETQEKQEQQQTEQQQIKSDIQALLEILGIETEEAKKFLGKTLVELIDENNQAIKEGRGRTIEVKDLKNFIDIFSKHEEALKLYKEEIEKRLNTAGKVGIGAMAILLMLIWASSKDRQQAGMH